ncbi:hypothetical protein [Methylobacterium oryzihabitans]|uniref:Uncharacterized protein n=1 Tax=Methylobacterium oryzihabitans TaxID=2499852 RepID=A0A437NYZ3_9HYPH|nr:hypothetical protein [Methylobacterium oryzihabitans]RVU15223.1 hypothetical protein EOE48_20670 [Methylobacterium oryzihabitans]
MSQPSVRPRVAVAASLIRCAPTPGSADVLDHVAALREEAAYLLRRYGRERRGITDEEEADALWLADVAGDLLALSDLYLHAPRPYRDDPRAGRVTRRPPALSGLVLIARGTPGPTDLYARG